ncbi:MAG: hypothetical protein AAB791_03480 [Patescibacteria group bacterium]
MMIFSQNLVYWSGILTGIFFALGFSGCRCFFKLTGNKSFSWIRKYHKLIIILSVAFFFLHLTLAVLSRNFNVVI